ncbi:MAG: hypothetical protein NTW87_05870 [Planctomycetota bacterium]|nr:hypothetical protein [Planctomycetota bacterium]
MGYSSDKQRDTKSPEKTARRKALLLGLGLDNQDGHVRITTGPNFHLVGGSKDTHEAMQETAIKLNEELGKRGKRLEQVGPKELVDILKNLH